MKTHSASRRQRLQEFEALCRREGLPLTVQRRAVLEAVLARKDHPTAEQVFDVVREKVAGISHTTVYRVLDTLVRVGVISRVCTPGASARFDSKVHQHHHLVCLQCNKILDIEDERLNALKLPAIDTAGYKIDQYHINFRGTCRECQRRISREDRQACIGRAKQGAPKSSKKTRLRPIGKPKSKKE